ncbi:F0F1 ATP synthase subunit epsilon [Bombella saccharophila]|uniref:ATP synthase epsilon chain n=1 Tax=Bombella saccharophila TaxID=2967338 RepID=A0ABT3W8N4_9PROT|nr:F0F1 ATP synthase subunit epsilon [Bombella saccharophila]MCX5615173.1 F0F1 ATP synthase subunit epsilon [Bombella saccharophila]PHI94153.1 F0F1 ATP synthase subunit epsilon [Parasaccharibacter apium]
MPLRTEIVSPERRYTDREVDMAVVPGTEGDIAAMPGRAPLMLQLRGGVVTLYQDGKVLERCFVGGGFVDMTADHCTILADSVRALEDLSIDDARQTLNELKSQWTSVGPDQIELRESLSRQIQIVRAEIEVAQKVQQNDLKAL